MIPTDRLEVPYRHVRLAIMPELLVSRNGIIKERKAEAEKNGQVFFDGPNTRLISWRSSPKDSDRVEHARDFARTGRLVRLRRSQREADSNRPGILYEYHVGLSDGDVSKSRLSNILDTPSP
jgi:hypothetical protein